MKSLISFHRAVLGYGKRPVLTDVNITVQQGDFLGILGPNGSGKSTILKTLLGLIPPLKGGIDAGHTNRLRFGYVPQKEKLDSIYPLTALEVAEMGTFREQWIIRRFKRSGTPDIIRKSLKECGVLNLAGRRYSELSGGQRQRVLISRALASEPDVLILDEPLAGIDVTTQKAILTLFREFKSRGLTMLMVSHRLQVERALFTHLAWVNEGRTDFGTTEEIMAKDHIAEVFQNDHE